MSDWTITLSESELSILRDALGCHEEHGGDASAILAKMPPDPMAEGADFAGETVRFVVYAGGGWRGVGWSEPAPDA